jgi:hypothetical protein
MTIQERVVRLAEQGIDMEIITMVLRSEGVPDNDIADAYDYMATVGPTEVIKGQYYMKIS